MLSTSLSRPSSTGTSFATIFCSCAIRGEVEEKRWGVKWIFAPGAERRASPHNRDSSCSTARGRSRLSRRCPDRVDEVHLGRAEDRVLETRCFRKYQVASLSFAKLDMASDQIQMFASGAFASGLRQTARKRACRPSCYRRHHEVAENVGVVDHAEARRRGPWPTWYQV